jgi:hypothetical protein
MEKKKTTEKQRTTKAENIWDSYFVIQEGHFIAAYYSCCCETWLQRFVVHEFS